MATTSAFPPLSVVPVTADKVFGNIHVCAGANFKRVEGLGVMASLNGDAEWEILFPPMPNPLPAGSAKLCLLLIANATSGTVKINPKWASYALGEDFSGLTLNAETTTADLVSGAAGATATVTWGAGDNDQILQAKWTLNADTVVAGEGIVMKLVFETSGWTLAQVLTVIPYIVFE
jgi:hypothetical protein